jgi:hypothetical protein
MSDTSSSVVVTDVSAGTITIAGGQTPIVLTPQVQTLPDGGSFLDYSGGLNLGASPISPGDALTITSSGATVPAFSIDITVPEAISITHPDPSSVTPLAVDRSMDLPIAWTGGGSTGSVTSGIETFELVRASPWRYFVCA